MTINKNSLTPIILFFIIAISSFSVVGQTPFLIKNLQQGAHEYPEIQYSKLADMGHYACFFADDGIHGSELWITDGTEYGTRLLKDIEPGKYGSGNPLTSFCRMGDLLFFSVFEGGFSGPSLWKTDGTPEGTVKVSAAPFSDIPQEITAIGNLVVFKVNTFGPQYTLWVSDGTTAGTKSIRQFTSPVTHKFGFAPYQNSLIFAAGNNANGVELWKTNGTTEWTVLVKDIYPGVVGSYPENFINFNNKVYFTSKHPDFGTEIWFTDGTSAGTQLLKDIKEGIQDSHASGLTKIKDTLYFTAKNTDNKIVLWSSDGTSNHSTPVNTGNDLMPFPEVNNILALDSFLLVSVLKQDGWELWRKNGDNGAFYKFKDHEMSGQNGVYFESWQGTQNRSFFTFRGNYSNANAHIWYSDGTESGTYKLNEIYAPTYAYPFNSRGLSGYSIFNNEFYFSEITFNFPGALWKSDGKEAPPTLVKKINNIDESIELVTKPGVWNNTLFFTTANYGIQPYYTLWKSNGSPGGTYGITNFNNSVTGMKVWNGHIFIASGQAYYKMALWKVDTTGAILEKIKDDFIEINNDFFEFDGKLYFTANTGPVGKELWVTDGTPSGTKLVHDIAPGYDVPYPHAFFKSDTHLFFLANDGEHGEEWWSLGKQDNAPVRLKDITPGDNATGHLAMGVKNGELFFWANKKESPLSTQLWKSNGTPAGTVKIADIVIDVFIPEQGVIMLNGNFYFAAQDATNGFELWQSNGTKAGTKMVKNINTVEGGSSLPYHFCNMGSYFVFYAGTPEFGYEPWRSDGTTAGTKMLKDINPGTEGSEIGWGNFFPYKGLAYFTPQTSETGDRLWVTDGTTQGTYQFKKLNDNKGLNSPRNFTATPNNLFFTANQYHDNKGFGEELWSLRFCTDSVSALPTQTYISFHDSKISDTSSCRCNLFGELIDKVVGNGGKPITGAIQSKVWIQENAPTGYVNKVFEIFPENKDSLATGLVTLYYSQEDFDAFNQTHEKKLPSNPTDSVGIKNLHVELRKGESKSGSGLPVSFTNQIETIQPIIDQIKWDSAKNRWEIEVAVTGGFGGFFVKADSCMLSESFTWRGSNSDDWKNENNWLEKTKPSTGANIIIPSNRRYYPLISDNISIRKLQLEKGATLKINPGVMIEINDKICQ